MNLRFGHSLNKGGRPLFSMKSETSMPIVVAPSSAELVAMSQDYTNLFGFFNNLSISITSDSSPLFPLIDGIIFCRIRLLMLVAL